MPLRKRERVITQGKRERTLKLKKLRVKRRNIVILAVSMFIANVAFGMAFPYLSVYMQYLGATMFMVGLLSVAFNLTSTVFQYPFGWLSDATRNRKGFIAFGAASIGLFYMIMAFATSPVHVLLLRTFQGAFGSAMTPAHSALISELSTRAGSIFGLFNSIENAGYMVGNFIGSAVVEYFGIKVLFIIAGFLLFLSAGIVLLIRERPAGRRSLVGMILVQEGRESWRATVKSSAFKKLMRGHLGLFYFTVFLVMVASGQFYSVSSVYFKEAFGEWSVGVLFGIESLAAALTGYFLGRLIDRYGAKRFYLVSIAGYAMAFVLYAVVRNVWLAFGVAFLSGIKWILTINSTSTYVARKVSVSERAQGMALLNGMMSLGWVVGPLIGGYLSEISFPLNFFSTVVPLSIAFVLALRLPE
ncbi:multidrug-efflux transporter [Thermococcus kodakarensis KOD1]|uniref:Multidrug-efflux transporter n=1 Tax=Thermococcus kodakarensis (strain ATCC BAA-918 / JCM 12380 / KOD1) TaxID=69014 RepID=Q5JFG1_THEKO|nr:MFS transporter [Thermococcus kodakarensis]WCN28231.1 MFS transporter [Thermococcus kodakarensis]WCN30527.1 MFS transporter [Thermococcus kodakarensis]BAD84312.1 multidrug-efflux transporter [Thermococcus kodakarensis KOD1]